MKKHYAIEWTYGRATDREGDRIGKYYWFSSTKDRQIWLDAGPEYTSAPGYREAIAASDGEIRATNRRVEKTLAHWDAIPCGTGMVLEATC